MPPKALAKTHMPSSSGAKEFLIDRIGRENLEQDYGGLLSPPSNLREYVAQGYWSFHIAEKNEASVEDDSSRFAVEL